VEFGVACHIKTQKEPAEDPEEGFEVPEDARRDSLEPLRHARAWCLGRILGEREGCAAESHGGWCCGGSFLSNIQV
jgi:hypothetical protein